MKYPKWMKNNANIGVVALSAGVGNDLKSFNKSINNIKSKGFNIIETASVRSRGEAANTGEVRAKELDELITNKDIDMVMCAAGGDFLIEVLPYVNYDNIKKNPKWLMGASDPTSILYLVTTKLDIATIYGHNAGSFDATNLHKSQEFALEVLKGNLEEQKSYDLYESDRSKRVDDYYLDTKVVWESNKDIDITGRIIGGCIDCLRDLPGTKYDYTSKFIEKYRDDGIIWYFDIFALTSEDFYRTLIQLRESGWFKYIKGVIVGRVMFPKTFTEMTYYKALLTIFKDIPIIYNADIGHVAPKMTIINGSIAHITCSKGKGTINFKLD